jgi:hypothetical protein
VTKSRIATKPLGKRRAQSYAERVAAGRKMVSVWLTPEQYADLVTLGEAWGMPLPRDVIAMALLCARGSLGK